MISATDTIARTRPPVEAERRLIAAVILAVMQDAIQFGDRQPYDDECLSGTRAAIRNSLRWFKTMDCGIYCDLLGYEQSALVAQVGRMRAEYLAGDDRSRLAVNRIMGVGPTF